MPGETRSQFCLAPSLAQRSVHVGTQKVNSHQFETTALCNALAQPPAFYAFLTALGRLTGILVNITLLERDEDVSLGTSVSPLCGLVASTRNGRMLCWRFLSEAMRQMGKGSSMTIVQCPAGLTEAFAPILADGRRRAFLRCGQFFRGNPSRSRFADTAHWLRGAHVPIRLDIARKAFFSTTALSKAQTQSLFQMLPALARQICLVADRWPLVAHNGETPCVAFAKSFAQTHLTEAVRTRDAANAAHLSEPYFCRVFKAVTGMTFSEYLARVRVEQAEQLLANSALRVTEVAEATGFRSIPHFNHTFKRYTGINPKTYRLACRKDISPGPDG